jgi:hypothetical protein
MVEPEPSVGGGFVSTVTTIWYTPSCRFSNLATPKSRGCERWPLGPSIVALPVDPSGTW